MDIKDIRIGMNLRHISDVGDPPQKLVVIYIAQHITDSPIRCEWLNRIGNLQNEWFRPEHLYAW